jgi:CubicO group peptidase (beta-lactamase class C family)
MDVFSASQTPDYWPTEGWLQSTADEQGLNGTLLEEMLAFCDNTFLQGIMVVRNGYNVLEEYPDPEFNESSLSDTWSVTKSVISILVGIALDEGYISSLDEAMVSFFPDRTIANLDSQKESITLKHLLTMKSGLQWNAYGDNDNAVMCQSSDWVQYVLDRPMSDTPGETWHYNSGATHILSAILYNTTGMTPSAFADIHLFQPLGIDEYEWETDPQGLDFGGWGLQLTLQDMAKIGFLFLHKGTWDAEQIVSAAWVEDSTKAYSTGVAYYNIFQGDYGYLWWLKPSYNAYCAFGLHGQFIWVFSDRNVIFVTKSSSMPSIDYMITEYILPSVEPPLDWVPIAIGASAVVIVAFLVIILRRR